MFVNCSNHPSEKWGEKQLAAAAEWGTIIDYPFPNVPADADEQYIKETADKVVEEIRKMKPDAVMCQGEFTLSWAVVNRLLNCGMKVMAACSERKVEERKLEDGTMEKTLMFQFVRFREYVR